MKNTIKLSPDSGPRTDTPWPRGLLALTLGLNLALAVAVSFLIKTHLYSAAPGLSG